MSEATKPLNNITAQDIVEAYKATKILPVYGDWGYYATKCGCGLTALSVHLQESKFAELDKEQQEDILEHVISTLSDDNMPVVLQERVTKDFVTGFVRGFDEDGIPTHYADNEEFVKGHGVGCEAAQLLFDYSVKSDSEMYPVREEFKHDGTSN